MSLQEMVNEYAVEHGITKDVIADQMGISRSTFFNKMRGTYEFSLSEAYALARIIGVSLDEFYRVAVG
nr:helix-turn-helix transcriptional regulator [uncultured Olsenella sp.]